MSNASIYYNGTVGDPISIGMTVYSEIEVPVSTEPVITNEYKRGEFIETWNKTYFMTDLSNIDRIIKKNKPEFYGLTFFGILSDIPTIQMNFDGLSGNSNLDVIIKDYSLITFIDGGKNFTFNGSRSENNVYYGWQPRSNTELFPYVCRSDVDAFDYPSYSVRGMRKIPATTADTLCGPENISSDRSFYNWFFGENSGIDFNPLLSGGTPIAISGMVITLEGVSTISTKEGKLLFYSDGLNIYTSGHTLMTNGDGLFGSSSSTQTCLVVPIPSTTKYYVFTTSITDGLRFNIVDMSLQSGVGEVTNKNNSLSLKTEKIAATNHGNGSDYWVISHATGNTQYKSYHIYSGGIQTVTTTSIGNIHNTAIGYMKFSPDSKKLVTAIYDEDIIDLFDFNTTGGTLSNHLTITGFTYINGPYGLEFSTDSSKLYVSDGASTKVYQFDLTYTAVTDMVNNAIEVGNVDGGSLGALQMGPDGRIYVADLNKPYLHVIHDSNKLGVECSFQENNFVLSGVSSGNTSQWGLPNVVSNNNFSCDRYVYLSPLDRTESFNFQMVFDNLSDVINEKKLSFTSKIYKYNYNLNVFDSQYVYETPVKSYIDLETNSVDLIIPYSGIPQGEFIIKNTFSNGINTLLSKQLKYNKLQTINSVNNLYGLYDPNNDWYFVNVYEAYKPDLINNSRSILSNDGVSGFKVESRITQAGVTAYTINISDTDQLGIVSYNGSVLLRGTDYTVSAGQIILNLEVLDNQILSVVYVSTNSTDTLLFNDSYIIVGAINSGATGTQTSNDKIFYNTDFNKYEFYLSAESKYGDNISMLINGSLLAKNVEYYLSTTNSKRIIIEDDINVGDIIQALYIPNTGILGGIDTNKPIFSWGISIPPIEPVNGDFTIEITDINDENFDSIIYTLVVPYQIDVVTYLGQVELTGAQSGDKFKYRIKNEKRYTPIMGETITDIVYSDVIEFELLTNIGNSY